MSALASHRSSRFSDDSDFLGLKIASSAELDRCDIEVISASLQMQHIPLPEGKHSLWKEYPHPWRVFILVLVGGSAQVQRSHRLQKFFCMFNMKLSLQSIFRVDCLEKLAK